MPNTIDIAFQLSAVPALAPSVPIGLRGSYTTTGNDIIQRTSSVATTPTAMDVGSIAGAPGLVALRCAPDSVDTLLVYTAVDGAAAKQYSVLAPGQFAVWAPSAGGTIWLAASATTARYEYLAVEGAVTGTVVKATPSAGNADVSAAVQITATMQSLVNSFSASFEATEASVRRRLQQFELAQGVDLEITTQAAGHLFVQRLSGDADSARLQCTAGQVFAETAALGFAFFPCPTMSSLYMLADTVGDSEMDLLNVARFTP